MLIKTIKSLLGGFISYLLIFTLSAFMVFYQIQLMGIYKKSNFKSRTEMGILTTMILFGQYDDMFYIHEGDHGVSIQDENNFWNITMTITFVIVLLVINIVLMNLLIAIVGQKFEDVTSMNGRIKLYTRIKQISKYTKKYDMIIKLKESKNYLIFVN